MRRKAKERMGNQIPTSVPGPGERRGGGVVKDSNGLPKKSQPRLGGGGGAPAPQPPALAQLTPAKE